MIKLSQVNNIKHWCLINVNSSDYQKFSLFKQIRTVPLQFTKTFWIVLTLGKIMEFAFRELQFRFWFNLELFWGFCICIFTHSQIFYCVYLRCTSITVCVLYEFLCIYSFWGSLIFLSLFQSLPNLGIFKSLFLQMCFSTVPLFSS